jgi:adenine deaminase
MKKMVAFSITGNLIDVHQKKIYPAEIIVENGKIKSIKETHDPHPDNYRDITHNYILPGFIDAHVHIESSMLIPSEFAKLAVVHGTVATVSDPHEIANVCGMKGVEFMIANGKTVPFKFHFGAPSCVPATNFETAGGVLDSNDVKKLLERDDIYYLSEMMNFPGVLNEDEEVMKKISAAHHLLKPVDGHAPGLRGDDAKKYIAAGITTDHECFTREEALDKLQNGMKIIIREGSAAKNFEALIDLLHEYPNQMMFCSDDKHPDSLVQGHINQLCARAVAKGIDLFKILQAACINPVHHYNMKVGLLNEGDAADLIVVKDLKTFEVLQTYIDGKLVAENGESKIESVKTGTINRFDCNPIERDDLYVSRPAKQQIQVIEALDGQLITNKYSQDVDRLVEEGKSELAGNIDIDILKIVVVNRYIHSKVAVAFIKNFGLKSGALASSVAHDSHNIVAVGVNDESIRDAVNMIIEHRGGVSFVSDDTEMIVPLPVAGLMSNEDGYKVAEQYSLIDKAVKYAGSQLSAPFMTLSFMALLVIPHLKLSDLGLFDGDRFELLK